MPGAKQRRGRCPHRVPADPCVAAVRHVVISVNRSTTALNGRRRSNSWPSDQSSALAPGGMVDIVAGGEHFGFGCGSLFPASADSGSSPRIPAAGRCLLRLRRMIHRLHHERCTATPRAFGGPRSVITKISSARLRFSCAGRLVKSARRAGCCRPSGLRPSTDPRGLVTVNNSSSGSSRSVSAWRRPGRLRRHGSAPAHESS